MSILTNTNAIANEIRMMKNKKFYVLVEGNFDVNFYSQFFDNEKTVIKSCNGKENVVNVYNCLVDSVDLTKTDIIFILDKDFDFYFNTNIMNEKVFYTDFHDLDLMLIEADSFDKFINYDCCKEKVGIFMSTYNIEDLKKYIFKIAEVIGHLRLISRKENYNFTFKTLVFKNFIGKEDLLIDSDKLITEVKNKSLRHDIKNQEILQKLSNPIDVDIYQLISGHDVINIICEAMKKKLASSSSGKYNHDLIQDKFLYGCNIDKFTNYNLCKNLKSYFENIEKPYIIRF